MQARSDWSKWAESLRRLKLDGFAAWLLEAGGPLTILGAQAVYMSQPFIGGKKLESLAQMLEEDEQTQAFARYLRGEGFFMMALGVLILAAVLLVGLTLWRRRSPATLRPIDAYERLNRSVGLAVENGTRLHISLGRGSLFTARAGLGIGGPRHAAQIVRTGHPSVTVRPSSRPEMPRSQSYRRTLCNRATARQERRTNTASAPAV
jgi:hypothetical protein